MRPAPALASLAPDLLLDRGGDTAPESAVEERAAAIEAARARPLLAVAPDVPPSHNELCAMIEAEANVRALSPGFFVRLIWQESRFKIHAVSPVGAQGIAQFMPATASGRGLEDPFDPVTALGESAAFLAELKAEFGNLGLAAAAYNAGPGRLQKWLNGQSKLPKETRDYVKIITGWPVEDWTDDQGEPSLAFEGEPAQDWCRELPVRPRRSPDIQQASAAAKSDSEPPEPAASKPWRVQIAADASREKARQLLARARKKHGKLLADASAVIEKKRVASKGRKPLYAVRIAMETRSAADALCAKLTKSGAACSVAKG